MFSPSTQDVAECLTPSALIEALRAEFRANGLADEPLLVSPLRAHHVIDAPDKTPGAETHLLMMPAWESGGVIGIKLVGVNAQNPSRADAPQPMVQGIYLLMDAKTGAHWRNSMRKSSLFAGQPLSARSQLTIWRVKTRLTWALSAPVRPWRLMLLPCTGQSVRLPSHSLEPNGR